jgi:hypothetical protein
MLRILTIIILIAGLLMQSCSKKSNGDVNTNQGNNGPVETATIKFIPDSMFRVYLKANVCPDAFDKTGKFIDITNSEVRNFNGTMQIDTVTCPNVSSLNGIQYFTNMKKLIVQNSGLDSLDLSATMGLDTVRILNNVDLQYVALNGCTSMRYIRVYKIPLVTLDLSNLPQLNYIDLLTMQRLSDLKTDNDANLRHIITYGLTSLKTVNVSTNPSLGRLYLDYCTSLSSLDLTHNSKLYGLFVQTAPNLKSIDLSKCDSLEMASIDETSIDSIDVSHNPKLFALNLAWSPYLRNLNLLANPKICELALDGCTALQTIDLRAQKSFDYYVVNTSQYSGVPDADVYMIVQYGLISPVADAQHPIHVQPTRAGVNGATQNLYGGLRVPQYLDANGISLTQIKVNDAVKDNYSLVMARRLLPSMTPALITVYADDQSTILCNDYDPNLFTCNH